MVSKDFAIIAIIAIIIVIVIVNYFMFIKIQKLSKNNIKENFSSDDLAKVRAEINKIYNMDVEAIRNLGAISKSLLTGTNTFTASATGTPGNLSIPADNTIIQGLTFKNTPWSIASNNGDRGTWENGHIYNENTGLSVVGSATPFGRNIRLYDNVGISGNLNVDGNILVDKNIYMAIGQHVQGAGRLYLSGPDNVTILNKQGLHISKHNGASSGNLTVDGDIKIGSTTIRSDGSITIGRTTIDKDGNITYGSIKPHPSNPETLLTNLGDSVSDGSHTDRCPEGKTMTGVNIAGWDNDIRRFQAVCR